MSKAINIISFVLSKIDLKQTLLGFVFLNTILSHSILPFNYRLSQMFVIIVFVFSLIRFVSVNAFTIKMAKGVILPWLYVLWCALTIVLSGAVGSLYGNMTSLFMPFYLSISLLAVMHSVDLRKIVDLMISFGIINLLISLYAFLTSDELIRSTGSAGGGLSAAGIMTDVNIASRYYCLLNGFVLYHIIKSGKELSWARFSFYAAFLLLSLVGITVVQSRSGYIMYLMSMSIPVFVFGTKFVKRLSLLLLPVVSVLFLLMTLVRIERASQNAVNWSDLGRISTFIAGINMAKDKPVLGVGYSRSKEFFIEYHDKYQLGPPEVKTIHNIYVNMVAETGLIGLLLYLTFVFYIMKGCFNILKRKDKKLSEYAFGVIIALIVSLFHGLLYHTMDYEGSFWLVITIGLIVIKENELKSTHMECKSSTLLQ